MLANRLKIRMELLGVRAVSAITRAVLAGVHCLLFHSLSGERIADRIQQILVYRIGTIGDILVTIPTLVAIRRRFPMAHIYLLTSPTYRGAPGARDLFATNDFFDDMVVYYVDDIVTTAGKINLIRRLRAQRFDLFIELSMNLTTLRRELRYLCFAKLIGCRYAVGFKVCFQRMFKREQMLLWSRPTEQERIYRSIADPLRLGPPIASWRLPVPDTAARCANELLESKGVKAEDRIVVMHPGARRETNRWDPDRFARVGDAIQECYNIRLVLSGSVSECLLVESVKALMRIKPVVVCGEMTVLQFAALLKRATLLICNDGGPMHIAASVGTATVSIFSGRDFPESWLPYGKGHKVLRRDVPCSPCFKEICDRGLICLGQISVEDVLLTVEQILNQPSSEARTESHDAFKVNIAHISQF